MDDKTSERAAPSGNWVGKKRSESGRKIKLLKAGLLVTIVWLVIGVGMIIYSIETAVWGLILVIFVTSPLLSMGTRELFSELQQGSKKIILDTPSR